MNVLSQIRLRPLDGLIILCLLACSFLPWLLVHKARPAQLSAELRVDGQVIKHFSLSQNCRYRYQADDGHINDIEVKDGKIGITYANCSDQICVRKGFISKSQETIVCLPHQLVIEIIGEDNTRKQVDY